MKSGNIPGQGHRAGVKHVDPLGLALGSPIFPSGCEGKLGVALESLHAAKIINTKKLSARGRERMAVLAGGSRGHEQRSFCHFSDCIQVLHFGLFC